MDEKKSPIIIAYERWYDLPRKFQDDGWVEFKMPENRRVTIDCIVYIYSNEKHAILYKTKVTKINIPIEDVEDDDDYIDENEKKKWEQKKDDPSEKITTDTSPKYMRLQLIAAPKDKEDNRLKLEYLQKEFKYTPQYRNSSSPSEFQKMLNECFSDSKNDDEIRFKHLLEYFVVHLECIQTKDENKWNSIRGYDQYIEPWGKSIKKSGLGKDGQQIQNQIENWAEYSGQSICINIITSKKGYKAGPYLHWKGTGNNIVAKWEEDEDIINGLTLQKFTDNQRKDINNQTIGDLGLFDNTEKVNSTLKNFFEEFKKMNENLKSDNLMESVKDLLLSNHNIILHGAPGTGKTYLAKQIAKEALGCSDNEIGFIQFHQSYDYTDFVEGLRPTQNSSFMLRDGVFKIFCATALENLIDSQKTKDDIEEEINERSFKYCYSYLARNNGIKGDKKIGEKEIVVINDKIKFKGKSKNRPLKLENIKLLFDYLMENQPEILDDPKNLSDKKLEMLIEKLTDGKTKRLDCYLVRPLLMDLAKVAKMDEKNLQEISLDVKRRDYCFIIDEINRGEMSKIFGELFYSIEPSYRISYEMLNKAKKYGEIPTTVKTQYASMLDKSNEFDDALGVDDEDNYGHFFIPDNVYIIGTMNDIDRSVESMDFAMRRRFAFKEITAEDTQKSMFGDGTEWKNGNDEKIDVSSCLSNIEDRMNNLNKAILNKELNLGQAYQIGGAYFLKFANYCKIDDNKIAVEDQDEAYKSLWKNHLECVLREYLRGMDPDNDKLRTLARAYGFSEEEILKMYPKNEEKA